MSIHHHPAFRYHECHSARRQIHRLRSTRDECHSDQHQLAPAQPVVASSAPMPQPPTPVKDYGRGRRGQIPNRQMSPYQVNSVSLNKVYSVDLNPETMDDVKWLHVNNRVSDYDQNKNLFVMKRAHDDYRDRVTMQITLELALKMQYKAQIEA